MARSILWPFRVTSRGGLALTSTTDQGQEETRQVVVLGHLPGPSGSPWGIAAGVGAPEVAFGLAGDPSALSPLVLHSQRFFRRFEAAGRGKLLQGFPRASRMAATGAPGSTERAAVEVQFVDLESGQPTRVQVPTGRR